MFSKLQYDFPISIGNSILNKTENLNSFPFWFISPPVLISFINLRFLTAGSTFLWLSVVVVFPFVVMNGIIKISQGLFPLLKLKIIVTIIRCHRYCMSYMKYDRLSDRSLLVWFETDLV